ncbi:MAG: GSU2403 family nucleotidyltransferase fold protein [Bacillota bacterium]
MEQTRKVFWETLKLFKDINLLQHLLLIGSWAEYIYEFAYYKDYNANLKTLDIDFLIKNINRPSESINISKILADNGYEMDVDYLTGVAKFYKDNILELEFLVSEKGRGQTEPYLIKSLGIRAEGLRHMEMLINNSITVAVNDYELAVQVPLPQAYLLHKMVISDKRTGLKQKKRFELGIKFT